MVEIFASYGMHMMAEDTLQVLPMSSCTAATLLQLHVPDQILNSGGEVVQGIVKTCLMSCLSNSQGSAACGCRDHTTDSFKTCLHTLLPAPESWHITITSFHHAAQDGLHRKTLQIHSFTVPVSTDRN